MTNPNVLILGGKLMQKIKKILKWLHTLSAIFFLSVIFTSEVFAENLQQKESLNQNQPVSPEVDAKENEKIEEKQIQIKEKNKDEIKLSDELKEIVISPVAETLRHL